MKNFINTMSRSGAGFLGITALILAMLFAYVPTAEAGTCDDGGSLTADADADGFTDAQECGAGITLVDCTDAADGDNGGAMDDYITANECATGANVPGCNSGSCTDPATMHPDSKDLFVILVTPETGSNIPANPFEYVSRSTDLGGLGVFVHQITPDQADDFRFVTYPWAQKAVRITESLSVNGTILGVANYGTPMGPDLATVYTQRIVNLVNENLAGKSAYLSGVPSDAGTIIDVYIRHTLAHEIGHSVMLVPEVYHNDRFGTYHWKTGTGYVMDQTVKMTKKGAKVTFFINDTFAEPSKVSPALR